MMTKGKESKPHIGIYGRMNNGKSSIINVLSNQDVAIVSDEKGTTTDPVKKSIEINGVGPVVMVDTAGIDDVSEVGKLRVNKALATFKQIDLGIIVITNNSMGIHEKELVDKFVKMNIPFFFIHNKSDELKLNNTIATLIDKKFHTDILDFSTEKPNNLESLVSLIKSNMPETAWNSNSMLGGLLSYGDIVLLITPIDIEAPQGRLILPQVLAIRDILDNDCVSIVVKEREVDSFLKKTGIKPNLVITDSQVFLKADASIPKDIPLTSFSIMLAKHKGDFENYLKGTPQISELKDGDKVLLLESCTHHVSCDDIGRTKIPRWLSSFTGKNLEYKVVSGLNDLPDIKDYSLVIQCGGCVLTQKQIKGRLQPAIDAGVPVTNYGMAIAYIQGIYNRATAPFVNEDVMVDYL